MTHSSFGTGNDVLWIDILVVNHRANIFKCALITQANSTYARKKRHAYRRDSSSYQQTCAAFVRWHCSRLVCFRSESDYHWETHCLSHLYTVKYRLSGAMRLRTCSHDFELFFRYSAIRQVQCFINTIQFCLLSSSLAVNNPSCIPFFSTSLITFPLACEDSFFLSFALQLLSLVTSRSVTHVTTISLSLSQCCHQCPLFFCAFQYFMNFQLSSIHSTNKNFFVRPLFDFVWFYPVLYDDTVVSSNCMFL